MALFSFTKLAVALVALLLARRVYFEATIGSRRRALRKQHGCLSVKPIRNKDPIFGIDGFIGNLMAVKEHRLLSMWGRMLDESRVHIIRMDILRGTLFLTDDPENVKTMLATKFDEWSIGRERIAEGNKVLGHGIFTTEGPAWKHSRDMLRPCFERSHVADFSLLEKHTSRLIELVPKDGTTVDLQPLLLKLTLDVSSEFLFGQSTNSLDPSTEKECTEFAASFDWCMNPFGREGNYWLNVLSIFLPDPRYKRHVKIVHDFVDRIIDAELASRDSKSESAKNRHLFLDDILAQTTDRARVRSELLNILVAGRDTTASLLTNLFFELPRHPEIVARLRAEIAEYVGSEPPTYEQLKDMRYLKAVINESQRLYPIVPSNSRQAKEDTILPRGGGPDGTAPLLVPKNTLVGWHSWSMHRRKDIYGPDAEDFNPSRWLDGEHESSPLRPGWGYLPFNGGPRVCIGQQFALTEVGFVVVRLLQEFPIMESRDDEVWRENLSLTCSSLGGAKVGLKTSE